MPEGMSDDDWKKRIKRAEAGVNRSMDPHQLERLKKQFETQKKKREVQDDNKKARDSLKIDYDKAKKDETSKGVMNVQQEDDSKKFIDDAKRKQAIDKAQGPEQVAGTV